MYLSYNDDFCSFYEALCWREGPQELGLHGTKTTAVAKCKDVVYYTSETLQIGPNIAYEGVTYPQEIIYETPK